MHKENKKDEIKKIAFFGTPPFTTDFLEVISKTGYTPSLVITAPDKPSGRGMKMSSPEPKKWADKNNIKVLQPEKLRDEFFEEISKETWDLFVVVAYGKIMPERIINLPKYGTINVHYSLLPKYRGATPVESTILNGDKFGGITIQQMAYELDAGDIIATEEIEVEEADTTISLREKLNIEALKILPETLSKIFDCTVTKTKQDDSKATFCKKITKEDGEINLGDSGEINDRKYRAYYGWPGSYFFENGKRVKITKAHFENGEFIVDEVIPENGKRMPYTVFLGSKAS